MSRQDSDLRVRWDEASAAASLGSLLRGKPASPYGTHQGRIDLRGLVIEQPGRTRVDENFERIDQIYEFNGLKIKDVDLSHSSLPEWRVLGTQFTNVVFDHASLPSLRTYSATFIDCSFQGSRLPGASLGAVAKGNKRGGQYERGDFTGADLGEILVEGGRLSNCVFVSTTWEKTHTHDAVIEQCDFRDADITDVTFDGRRFSGGKLAGLNDNKLSGCDFSTARLTDCRFPGIDFRNVVPPKAERYVLVPDFPRRVDVALDRLNANGSSEARFLPMLFKMEFSAAKVLPADATGMIDFGKLSQPQAALLDAVFELSL
jgi:uncharacterized protein YjbI with pentapeptide repeats